jgi:hypothetical protein
MKDTGKTIHGAKVYSDPEVPPNTLYMLNNNFKEEQPRRTNGTFTAVTQSEKLEALITRAIANDFQVEGDLKHIRPSLDDELLVTFTYRNRDFTNSAYFFLFNHDFAKALFGEEKYLFGDIITEDTNPFDRGIWFTQAKIKELKPISYNWDIELESWQYHLQQAVIADNPIDYMYDEVFGK